MLPSLHQNGAELPKATVLRNLDTSYCCSGALFNFFKLIMIKFLVLKMLLMSLSHDIWNHGILISSRVGPNLHRWVRVGGGLVDKGPGLPVSGICTGHKDG